MTVQEVSIEESYEKGRPEIRSIFLTRQKKRKRERKEEGKEGEMRGSHQQKVHYHTFWHV